MTEQAAPPETPDPSEELSQLDEPIEDLTSIWGGISINGQLANQGAC